MHRPAAVVASVLFTLTGVATAQTPASASGLGTVTGHVTCNDTQRPARFAAVVLFGVPLEVTMPPATPPDPKDPAAVKAAIHAGLGNVTMAQGQTGLDGSFTVTNVAPGEYYAFSSVAGYVSPVAMLEAAYAAGADVHKPVPGIPLVHVAAEGTANVELTAQRGAAITGRVVWDDGSPVSHAVLAAEKPGSEQNRSQLPTQFTMLNMASMMNGASGMVTDDQGRYRLSGLMPGRYVVKASTATGGGFGMVAGEMKLDLAGATTPLVIYAPATVHKAEAETVTVAAGEEHGGEDITLNLSGMHSVSGMVRSTEDGHGINSASVTLVDAGDKNFKRSAGVDANGAFTVTLLPPGTYDLTVEDAEDTRPSTKKSTGLVRINTPETVRSYGDGKASVVVTSVDVTGQTISLKPAAETAKKPDLSSVLSQ